MSIRIALIFVIVTCALLTARIVFGDPATRWTTALEATPAGSDLASTLDNKITEFKGTVREYAETELCWGNIDNDGCPIQDSGRLREGACRVFAENSSPSALHANDWATSSTADLDQGRLWVDTDGPDDTGANADDNQLYVYDSSFELVNGVPTDDRTNWDAADAQVTEHLKAVRVRRTGTQDLACVVGTAINWDTESGGFDDDAMHDDITNNERLTTPSNATRVRLFASIDTGTSVGANRSVGYAIRQDGSTIVTQAIEAITFEQPASFSLATGPVAVTGGTTYFEVILSNCSNNDNSLDVVQTTSSFSMEVIQ